MTDKKSLLELVELVKSKLAAEPEAACGLFWSDDAPIYILPPPGGGDDDDDNHGPIYILPPPRG